MSEKIDVLVIGAGPAGVAAGIGAKREGAENVVVLERDWDLGGILQQCIHPGFGLRTFKEELTGPEYIADLLKEELSDRVTFTPNEKFIPERRNIPRFLYMDMASRKALADKDPAYAQIVCRCETVTEGQVLEAIRRGARTVSAVKMMTRAGTGRCQGGFCCPRVAEILARELGLSLDEVTRHGGESRLLVGKTKEFLLKKEGAANE